MGGISGIRSIPAILVERINRMERCLCIQITDRFRTNLLSTNFMGHLHKRIKPMMDKRYIVTHHLELLLMES